MLLFDIHTLEKETLCDPDRMVFSLYKFFKGEHLPKNSRDKYKPIKALRPGSSFLLNPIGLFNDRSTDVIFKAQYIRLAARRDLTLYKAYGTKTLDLAMYPDLNFKNISRNPLLTITQHTISFKYEEQ